VKVGLVSSAGGHLTETLQLLEAFEGEEIFFVTWHSSRDEDVKKMATSYFTNSFGNSPVKLLMSLPWAWGILNEERPDVIVSLGAEIALPFFYLGKLLGIKTIFIESVCRVEGLSKTGKLVYSVSDVFLVQWPELLKYCGNKAQYKGAVI
jgi:beta-1,4-N-acetylglucosaminyltransferase